jgi:hypothetical protein
VLCYTVSILPQRPGCSHHPIANAWRGPHERVFEEGGSFNALNFGAVGSKIIEINRG